MRSLLRRLDTNGSYILAPTRPDTPLPIPDAPLPKGASTCLTPPNPLLSALLSPESPAVKPARATPNLYVSALLYIAALVAPRGTHLRQLPLSLASPRLRSAIGSPLTHQNLRLKPFPTHRTFSPSTSSNRRPHIANPPSCFAALLESPLRVSTSNPLRSYFGGSVDQRLAAASRFRISRPCRHAQIVRHINRACRATASRRRYVWRHLPFRRPVPP